MNRRTALHALLGAFSGLAAVGLYSSAAAAEFSPYYTTSDPPGGALAGDRPRVFVSTDINPPDPSFQREFDDRQSMVHLLLYADVLDIEGIDGDTNAMEPILRAYESDYANLSSYSTGYPKPADLRARCKSGTAAQDLLIARAKAADARPLYVLTWGALWQVSATINRSPDIASKIRLLSVNSYNTNQVYGNDPPHRNLYNNYKNLYWIASESTFEGNWEVGPNTAYEWTNEGFVKTHAAGHGALGKFYSEQGAHWWGGAVYREGDSNTLLYLLRGDLDRPEDPHWGGRYQRPPTEALHGTGYVNPGPNFYIDATNAEGRAYGNTSGGNSFGNPIARWGIFNIATYRLNWLADFARRFDRAAKPSSSPPEDPPAPPPDNGSGGSSPNDPAPIGSGGTGTGGSSSNSSGGSSSHDDSGSSSGGSASVDDDWVDDGQTAGEAEFVEYSGSGAPSCTMHRPVSDHKAGRFSLLLAIAAMLALRKRRTQRATGESSPRSRST
jgi:uncharacterized membrane protein YgcG